MTRDPELSIESTVVDRAGPSGDPFDLSTGDMVDRYEVVGRIGRGGMGVVYRARDPTLDREIALKLVRADRLAEGESSQARLLREAQAMAQVSHPNVLPIYDVGIADRGVFIAMELVAGQSLSRWRSEQPRRSEEIVDMLVTAGQGLMAVHEAGLIHRDFKPSNVLIDQDRVLVMDFGLARVSGPATQDDHASEAGPGLAADALALDNPLTQASVVLGTPAYMAPEQMLGDQEVGQACDQFAFCVTLFEILFGRRPYAGTTMLELYWAKSKERWEAPEPRDRLTQRVLPVLRRGLASRPADRWPSMLELVSALQQARAEARRRRWLPWGTGAVLLLLVVGAIALVPRGEAETCEDQDALEGIWDEGQRRAVQEAWQASEAPYQARAWAKVEPRLHAYAEAWRAQHRALCQALSDEAGVDSAGLDRRSSCLDDRRRHLAALVQMLQRPDPAVVETAAQGVAALPRLERCESAEGLGAPEPPLTPEQALAVAEVRDDLARVEALTEAGLFDEALALARQVSTTADALGHAPLRVTASIELGRLQLRRGEQERARDSLSRGYFAAREKDMDEAALDAAIGLVEVATWASRFDEGMQWSRTAEALLLAMGNEPTQRARVLQKTGALLSEMGQEPAAVEKLEQALRLEQEAFGGADPRVALTRLALGTSLRRQGRLEPALAVLNQALATAQEAYDPSHPSVAKFHNRLGNALVLLERLDEALYHYERAEAISRAAFGDDHPMRAGYLISRSQIHLRRDELPRAEALTAEALSLWEAAHGSEHPMVALALNNLGTIAERQHRDDEAVALYRRALRISEVTFGPTHPKLVMLHRNLGELLLRLGRYEPAREQLGQALAITQGQEAQPGDLASLQFAMARLRWEAGEDRAGARAEVERARAVLAELGEPVAGELEAIDGWLAEHPLETGQ